MQCPQLFDDITFLGEWEFDEIGVAEAVWAPKLNQAVAAGAENAGFTFVDGIYDAFKKHGMCATDRYINTATDSLNSQGDSFGEVNDGAQSDTTGTAHPNTKGYAAYADRILEYMGPLLENEAPEANDDEAQVAFQYANTFNVLTNDYDPDEDDVLAARLLDPPSHGTVTMLPNGQATYKASGKFVGTDTFTYEVTDGEYTDQGTVDVTVGPPMVQSTEVLFGTTTVIGGLLGGFSLSPPYLVVFDKPLKPKRGLIAQVPGQAAVSYTAPDVARRRRIKLPYTIQSLAPIPNPDSGKSVRGVLKIMVLEK